MGTTVVALCLGKGDEGWVAHVGDSRLYQLRSGRLDPLTADHSLVGEMQRLGMLSAAEAETHPRRNELTRSVGVGPSVEAEIAKITVEPGDRFLLCSDGLCIHLGDDEIREVLERERPSDAARTLVDQANAKGGHDNVTVQVVSILETASPRRRGADPIATARSSPESLSREHLREARTIRWAALATSSLLLLLLVAAAFWLLRS
jgi:serine/threonine protein phosphatase PrpC